jgi:tRNA1Val (adenine37-N6)-methyltransferase
MPLFRLKQFSISDDQCTMPIGSDVILLGCAVDAETAGRVLDIGTGSGVLVIMIAQKSGAQIDGIDIHEPSIQQALENVRNCPWHDRIRVYHSSLQEFKLAHPGEYDLIVSNPPFYTNSLKGLDKKKNLARHADTLTYEELIVASDYMLKSGGRFSLILPYHISKRFKELALLNGLYCNKNLLIRPKADKDVNRIIMEFGTTRKHLATISTELVIRHEDDTYTREYMEFTREYYLNF